MVEVLQGQDPTTATTEKYQKTTGIRETGMVEVLQGQDPTTGTTEK